MTSELARSAAQRLRDGSTQIAGTPALLGFDGFIDTISHVVDTRQSATEYTRLRTISEYGARVLAAAGQSTNIEIVPQAVKLGGNGPIMANAMAQLGTPVTYIGMTGYPHTQDVFADFGTRAKLLPISEAALTDAIEFEDGKLIVGKHATVGEVTYENLLSRVGAEHFAAAWHESRFVGMVNWTMLPYLTDIWQRLQADFSPNPDARKLFFFDLADPEKRSSDDLREGLRTLAAFSTLGDVVLGVNEKESLQVAEALGLPPSPTSIETNTPAHLELTAQRAAAIRAELGIAACAIHPTAFAAGADASGQAAVHGPYTPQPKISTGAGDHFNAGLCAGLLCGATLPEALQCGVATSGFYVRNAQSPTLPELAVFLEELA